MLILTILREMGWTYKEYLDQPVWLIDSLIDKMQIDSDNIKKIAKKI